jgi:hypothetical protein
LPNERLTPDVLAAPAPDLVAIEEPFGRQKRVGLRDAQIAAADSAGAVGVGDALEAEEPAAAVRASRGQSQGTLVAAAMPEQT